MLFPSKVGTGTLGVFIGFTIPLALFFFSPPVEQIAERVLAEQEELERTAQKDSSRLEASSATDSHDELAEIIVYERPDAPDDSARARWGSQGPSDTSKQLLEKNNELLRILEREYEELELDADKLLGVAGVVVEREEVQGREEEILVEQSVTENENLADGGEGISKQKVTLKVVGEGKQWLEEEQPQKIAMKVVGEGKQWLEPVTEKPAKKTVFKEVGEGKTWLEPVEEARAQPELQSQILRGKRKPEIQRESVDVKFGRVESITQ